MYLPIELVELILSNFTPHTRHDQVELNKSDTFALAKCALVCRAWVAPSRRILFRNVTIVERKAYTFERLFPSRRSRSSRDTTFYPFVRELHFRLAEGGKRWLESTFQRNISPHLQNTVRHLWLHGQGFVSPGHKKIKPCPTGFTQVTHLRISGVWGFSVVQMVEFIASFPMLEELTIGVSEYLRGAEGPMPSNQVPAMLRRASFKWVHSRPIFDWVRLGRPTGMEALRFHLPNEHDYTDFAASVFEYIAQQGSSLLSLGLMINDQTRWLYDARGLDTDSPPLSMLFSAFLRSNSRLQHLFMDVSEESRYWRSSGHRSIGTLLIRNALSDNSSRLRALKILTVRSSSVFADVMDVLRRPPLATHYSTRFVYTGSVTFTSWLEWRQELESNRVECIIGHWMDEDYDY
ncbi:BHLH domain-containing protein [Mycena indigotica]|uniref:BHLH domain-containing protein n=1 Tax=Mycena indigotica TaxID=2126181 RepID=A0A8H6SG64_9AGAR|nr:BHLH domain-containing protein [Mycena indigotica]KAF7297250.1 BHLH domain-containing protein [Mycena indigotica]